MSEYAQIASSAREMRRDIIRMTYSTGRTGAHVGGALSLVEIMAALYLEILHISSSDPEDDRRDRLILSKGHGVMAQYAAMRQAGLLTEEDLLSYKKHNTNLSAHPSMNPALGVEFSSGSLGQGLSQGVGSALALRRKGNNSRVFVILGDGECDEGSIWEAAMSASHFNLTNLVAIVDENQLQYDGTTSLTMNLAPFGDKWRSFGWAVDEVDGHDLSALLKVLSLQFSRPHVILARTVKGKGVSFMENEPKWHNGRLTQEQFEQAMAEQEESQ